MRGCKSGYAGIAEFEHTACVVLAQVRSRFGKLFSYVIYAQERRVDRYPVPAAYRTYSFNMVGMLVSDEYCAYIGKIGAELMKRFVDTPCGHTGIDKQLVASGAYISAVTSG